MRYSVRDQCRTQAHEVSRSDPHTYDRGCLSWYWWLQGRFSCCKILVWPKLCLQKQAQYFWTSYINISGSKFWIFDNVIALRIRVAVNLELENHEMKERTSCQKTCRKTLQEAVTYDLPVKWSDCIWGRAPILTNPSTVTVPNPLPNAMILSAWKLPSIRLSLSGDTPTNSKSMQTTGPTQSSSVKVVQISDPVSNNATWWIWPWLLAT